VSTPACSRRRLLRAGLASGSGLLAATLGVASAHAEPDQDRELLRQALTDEQMLVVAYATALGRRGVPRRAQLVLGHIREQEIEHAQALLTALRERGDRAPAPPSPGAPDSLVPGLSRARSPRALLNYLLELETVVAHRHAGRVQRLIDDALIRISASVLGNEAQHVAMLRELLGLDPLAVALEVGLAPPAPPGAVR